jgi:hypothetical protein
MLLFHLRLLLPSHLFPADFTANIYHLSTRAAYSAHLIRVASIALLISDEVSEL